MALSRIWSAFIIVAVLVGAYKWIFTGDETIFNRMVVGKADDATDSIGYILIGQPEKSGFASRDAFVKNLTTYGYSEKDSVHKAKLIIAENENSDEILQLKSLNPAVHVYSFRSVQTILTRKADGIIETCKTAVTICIGLIGILALFMGFLAIAEKAGGIRFLSKIVGPFFSKLFPELPKGHPAMGHMIMNFSANLLNLDNAATPFAIKAMESLQELNPHKEKASNAQIMFLCLHASGLTLIPVSIIAVRAAAKAQSPTDIFVPCLIVTFVATLAAMSIVSFKQKINLFQPVILGWIGGLSAIIAALVVYIKSLNADRVQVFSGILSNGLLVTILLLIVAG
ncbi:MAG: nucleoside recognition domain-containing protein, partial [Bacteroidota bacterium]